MARRERQEREIRERRKPRKRRRRLNPKAVLVLAGILLVLAVCLFIGGRMLYERYSPSKEMADLNEYFQLTDDQDMAVILNDEILEDKARLIDGRVYLNVETVYQYLDERYYWDAAENLYLYALPTELVSVGVGSSEYTVARSTQSVDYVILRVDGSNAYVAADFLKNYTNFTYEFWEEPNRVYIVNEFGTRDVVTAQTNAPVRYKAGAGPQRGVVLPQGNGAL